MSVLWAPEDSVFIMDQQLAYSRTRQQTQHETCYSDDLDESRIRIFTLHPGVGFDPLQATFTVINLKDDQSEFAAISHNWTTDESDDVIYFGDISLQVPLTLAACLRQIRHPKKEVVLWADAICIDQCDPSEKRTQIALLAGVFSQAQEVIIWLGPETDWSAQLFDELNAFADEEAKYYAAEQRTEDTYAHWQARRKAACAADPGFLDRALQMLQHPYWSRSWIVQEVFLAKGLHICCGDRTLSPSSSWLIRELATEGGSLSPDSVRQSPGYRLLTRHFQMYQSNRHWISRSSNLSATKPRSKFHILNFQGLPTPETLLAADGDISPSHFFLSGMQSCNTGKGLLVIANLWTQLSVDADEMSVISRAIPGLVHIHPMYEMSIDKWVKMIGMGLTRRNNWSFAMAARSSDGAKDVTVLPHDQMLNHFQPEALLSKNDVICGLDFSIQGDIVRPVLADSILIVFEKQETQASPYRLKRIGMMFRRTSRHCLSPPLGDALIRCFESLEQSLCELNYQAWPEKHIPQTMARTGFLPWFWHLVPKTPETVGPFSLIKIELSAFISLIYLIKTIIDRDTMPQRQSARDGDLSAAARHVRHGKPPVRAVRPSMNARDSHLKVSRPANETASKRRIDHRSPQNKAKDDAASRRRHSWT